VISVFRFFIFAVPVSLLSFLYFFINDNDYYPGADFTVSEMPAFELNALYDNSIISNSDLKGSYLINVWASWCITCRIEHGFLVRLDAQNIPIVGLNYKDDKDDERYKILQENGHLVYKQNHTGDKTAEYLAIAIKQTFNEFY